MKLHTIFEEIEDVQILLGFRKPPGRMRGRKKGSREETTDCATGACGLCQSLEHKAGGRATRRRATEVAETDRVLADIMAKAPRLEAGRVSREQNFTRKRSAS